MIRIAFAAALCAMSARVAVAQAVMPGTAAKAAARNAANATSEHIANEQKTGDVKLAGKNEQKTGEVVKPAGKPVEKLPPATPAGKPAASAAAKKQATGLNVSTPGDTSMSPPATIMREVFDYSRDGRRDPFVSLMGTSDLRPTMSDLKLTTIMYDPAGRHSLAVLRDVATKEQYRVTTGSILGRMRVAAIRAHVIVFTINEFGTNRQDSLTLGDTTKARLK